MSGERSSFGVYSYEPKGGWKVEETAEGGKGTPLIRTLERIPMGEMVRREIRAGVAGVLAASAIAGCSIESGSQPSTASPETSTTESEESANESEVVAMSDEELAEVAIGQLEPCEQLDETYLETNPDAVSLSEELDERDLVVVDGRCHPFPDDPVGLYEYPEQTAPGTAPLTAETGDMFTAEGTVEGDLISNNRHGSTEWVEVENSDSSETSLHIPAVWTANYPVQK